MLIKKRIQDYFSMLQSEIAKQNEEIIWANVWHDTCGGVSWLKDADISLSPGRWAVGYNYLYVMTRILNELNPTSILEFGLGISTTLISQYFLEMGKEEDCHIVIEHDNEWIGFYTKTHGLSKITRIEQQELIEDNTANGTHFHYKDISKIVSKHKFQVISIDAPFGGDVDSRSDILAFIPEILADDFVIVLDDANRIGEKTTLERMKKRLDNSNIAYSCGLYKGVTDVAVVCSDKVRFLASL